MRVGNYVRQRLTQNLRHFLLLGFLCCYSFSVYAIDNPDAPDYLGDFANRAQTYEQDIQQTAYRSQDYIAAYAAYENFLDQELNNTYQQLMAHLNADAQQALKDSQHKWLAYRDAEFDFIAGNWTAKNFGSASVISRGDYRTQLVKDRVIRLLHYLKNY